jgi:methylated-DNA-[protein]-cysteine S-methyltransferase
MAGADEMKSKSRHEVLTLPISTHEGKFIARYSLKGLAALEFPSKRAGESISSSTGLPMTVRRWHRIATIALKRALAGRAPRVLPPLDLSAGTAFQQRVWNSLLKISRGQTRSYGEIAQSLRQPRASRAVGGACGANPIPIFVPCHRVRGANQKLGGYSGGLDWKRTLLWREDSREWWPEREREEKEPR